jgi:hypothetical protein
VKYCIDTSSLIAAWERAYPLDCFPSFWKRMDGLAAAGTLIAPQEVKHELQKQSGVWTWAKPHSSVMFLPDDEQLQRSLSEVLGRFTAMMKRKEGRHAADPWVVALARNASALVVTEEGAVSSESNPKIPLVCGTFGVPWIPLRELIRREKWSF